MEVIMILLWHVFAPYSCRLNVADCESQCVVHGAQLLDSVTACEQQKTSISSALIAYHVSQF